MKIPILVLLIFTSLLIKVQTPINDANFQQAINTCLSTNPIDGMCSDSEYGALPDWDVSFVTDMSKAFRDQSDFNGDLSNWDLGSVTSMYYMFLNASAFNGDLSNWNVSSVTNMGAMFANASAFNGALSNWNVSSVTNMNLMFFSASSFTGDLSRWNVSSVTDMGYMFYVASAFNGDLSRWNVSSVTMMDAMFAYASAFNRDLSNWNVSSVTSMYAMCIQALAFNQDIDSWDVSTVTDTSFMFYEALAFNQDISSWDVGNITDMSAMFDNSGLSTTNYDALLNAWSQQVVQENIVFGAAGLTYCDGEDARQDLRATYGWTITDGGLDCTVLNLENQNRIAIALYPNPANDKLYIQGLSNSSKILIYNVFGRLVFSETTSSEVDLKGLQSGIYMVKIMEQQKETTRKFLKN
jgi:surface protein